MGSLRPFLELWKALTDPEFTRRWCGSGEGAVAVESDWRPGSPVTHRFAGADAPFMRGEVIEADPPHVHRRASSPPPTTPPRTPAVPPPTSTSKRRASPR
ncbi:SRPBCC domain-containing protein [Streptomyces himastatinicus]|uniref:SRPBCC domain-containing protein n=1 Tax=Streptomyces himastatinicus TaxID=998084 RepID=UPI000997048E|nr:SRPBCC domain-containing protein [Streptomyces himastatinicus]